VTGTGALDANDELFKREQPIIRRPER